jgi:hypothetical protein
MELHVGDRCEGNYQGLGIWYPGKITNIHSEDGSIDINYDDGDVELRVRKMWVRSSLKVGDKCEANYHGRGMWYKGTILAVNETNGAFNIQFDDGDREDNVLPTLVRRQLPTQEEMIAMAERDAREQNIWCHECQCVVGPINSSEEGESQCPKCNGCFVEVVDDVHDHPQNFVAANQVEAERRTRQSQERTQENQVIQNLISSLGGLFGGGGSGGGGGGGSGGQQSTRSSETPNPWSSTGSNRSSSSGGGGSGGSGGGSSGGGSGGGSGGSGGSGNNTNSSSGQDNSTTNNGGNTPLSAFEQGRQSALFGPASGQPLQFPQGGIASTIAQVIGSITSAIPQQNVNGGNVQVHVLHGGNTGGGLGGLAGLSQLLASINGGSGLGSGGGSGGGGGGDQGLEGLSAMISNMIGSAIGGGGGLASNPGDYVNSQEALESLMTQLLQASGMFITLINGLM